jgi:hypothetical protein
MSSFSSPEHHASSIEPTLIKSTLTKKTDKIEDSEELKTKASDIVPSCLGLCLCAVLV